jgi:hypothetical protein
MVNEKLKMKTARHLDMNISLLTARPALKNTGSLMPHSLTASHNKPSLVNLPLLLGNLQTHNNCDVATHCRQL